VNASKAIGFEAVMTRKLLYLITLLVLAISTNAQRLNIQQYSWEAADLALVYPYGWDAPLPTEIEGRLVLQMAQTLVDSPDVRPPGVSFITLTIYPVSDFDLYDLLTNQLTAVGITPNGQALTHWFDSDTTMTDGYSEDGLLYGIGQAVTWSDGRTLTMVGRAIAERRAYFMTLFDNVAGSLVFGATSSPNLPTYNVLWYSERTLADGQEAFLDVVSMALTNEKLYLLDTDLGVVQMNPQTGVVEVNYPFEGEWLPTDMAVDDGGRILVTDLVCNCVHVLQEGRWSLGFSDFGIGAPVSVAVTPDNIVYVTDEDSTGIVVHAMLSSGTQIIPLGEEVASQPRLFVDRGGRLLALTDTGRVLRLEGESFIPVLELGIPVPLLQDVTVDADNNLTVLTADRGVLTFNAAGEFTDEFGRIVSDLSLPGELQTPRTFVVLPDSTLFIVDTDGSFGRITAFSTLVERGRIGSSELVSNVLVQGALDEEKPRQYWTFVGSKGQEVTLSAVDADQTDTFNVELRLLDPVGNEEAFNDDQETQALPGILDAQIANHNLARDGRYTVVVERVAGEGTYRLGLIQPQPIEVESNTLIRGELPDVLPANLWTVEGNAGEIVTITMLSSSGDLDPALRLFDTGGNVIAENDDAADVTLGNGAQLFEVRLPRNGSYIVEAGRFTGTGRYSLEIAFIEESS
jgi:hypothetical protein